MDVIKNNSYDEIIKPYVSIITPVFNRRDQLIETMKSVENQSIKNFEYIIVNDGSTIQIDDIVIEFMNRVSFPVIYIKKKNGGVHSARNVGIKYSRGEMYLGIDSDDRLLPNAVEILCREWNSIPINIRDEYFEIKARCIDENGLEMGVRFVDGINQRPWEEVKKYYESLSTEHIGFRVMKILKDNPWPEPEGVSFVSEAVVWNLLRQKYKTWLINDAVRIYNTSGSDHLSSNKASKKRTIQERRNALWNQAFFINNHLFVDSIRKKCFSIFNYCMIYNILSIKKDTWKRPKLVCSFLDNLLKVVFWVPSLLAAYIYINKKM